MIGALVVLSLVEGAYATTTAESGGSTGGNTVQEGPWQVKIGDKTAGYVVAGASTSASGSNCYAASATCSDAGVVFDEYFKKDPTYFKWLGPLTTWTVSVSATVVVCTTAVCQHTQSTTTTPKATIPKKTIISDITYQPPETTPTGAADNRYHAPGRYRITESIGSTTSYVADYYVVKTGFNERTEFVCARVGFGWPSAAAGSVEPAHTWTIEWENTDAFTGCPAGDTLHSYVVNLNPR